MRKHQLNPRSRSYEELLVLDDANAVASLAQGETVVAPVLNVLVDLLLMSLENS
jgi:hypothetical protein